MAHTGRPGNDTKLVRKRRLAAEVKVACHTLHHVALGMDRSPILAQEAVPVIYDSTAETLREPIKEVEYCLHHDTRRQFVFTNGRIS